LILANVNFNTKVNIQIFRISKEGVIFADGFSEKAVIIADTFAEALSRLK
jgi:hypothetical protein